VLVVCITIFYARRTRTNLDYPVSSPKAEDSPEPFVQGSSRDGEVGNLARLLQQSKSFDETHTKKVWQSGEDAELWNF
jgi:hypothetical protein